MDTTSDRVLAQLRKLREGRGLSAARLQSSGDVMSALSASDPDLAYRRLVAALEGLGDGERQRALRLDFGLDLATLLQREPEPRELDWLGDRRSAYGLLIGRDEKTLARWSDRALGELRLALNTDQFSGDLIVVAAVDGERIVACSLVQSTSDEDGSARRTSTDVPNHAEGPSLPLLVYGFPRDWHPRSLTLIVEFMNGTSPERVRALVASNFFELAFAQQSYDVNRQGSTASCTFKNPRIDQLYALTWDA